LYSLTTINLRMNSSPLQPESDLCFNIPILLARQYSGGSINEAVLTL